MRAARALRGDGERAVFDEAAGIAQVVDVFACGAQPERVPALHCVGPRVIECGRLAIEQLLQVGARRLRLAPRRQGIGNGVRRNVGAHELQQRVAFGHQLAFAREHGHHARVVRRGELVLHLHGFEDQQQLAGAHLPAGRDRKVQHRGGHRRADL